MILTAIKFTPLATVLLTRDEATVLRYQFKEQVVRPHRRFHIDSRDGKLGCPTCLAQIDLLVKLDVAVKDIDDPIG